MNDDEELRLRRDLRAAIFRAARLQRAGRSVEAEEQLAGELAAAQARLAALGRVDAAQIVQRWRGDDEAALDLATLVAEFVTESVSAARSAPPAPSAIAEPTTAAGAAEPPAAGPASANVLAFPPPPTGVPGLADLLDDMLAQDRRARPRLP